MILSRRAMLQGAGMLAAPAIIAACGRTASLPYGPSVSSLSLAPDPKGLIDLPAGFSYAEISRAGEIMSDGLVTPAKHDGMGLLPIPGDPDRCVLMCNHEIAPGADTFAMGAFAREPRRIDAIDPALIYDRAPEGMPLSGGVTRRVFNLRTRQVESSHLSLAGTSLNCSGGVTPWGTWLSGEETEVGPSEFNARHHGYVFEAAADATGLVQPIPLRALGRFKHEAVAIDPSTGILYLTEDDEVGCFYRLLPASRGELIKGGRLQALVLLAQAGADTRNWPPDKGGDPAQTIRPGQRHAVRWIDLDHVDTPDADLRLRARAKGAAIFARSEGAVFHVSEGCGGVSFTATTGGPAGVGQVWRYMPGEAEGQADEASRPGVLTLSFESQGRDQMDRGDAVTAMPGGGLVICEDGKGEQFVRGLTAAGLVFPIARNALNESEFCGACFSPDGQTMFVNLQDPGLTLAITGPWDRLVRQAALAV